jgi:prokaryotic ubiquitin-like protein Pup
MGHDDDRENEHAEEGMVELQRHEKLSDDVDAVLDELDEVLEENAEEFVRSYVRKGGQGASFDLTMQFLAETAALGILQGLTYDSFKRIISRITKVFTSETERVVRSPLEGDEYYEEETEADLKAAWIAAIRVIERRRLLDHTNEEAAAFKAIIFANEMQKRLGSVHLGATRYDRLAREAAARNLTLSKLAERIIDEWLKRRVIR